MIDIGSNSGRVVVVELREGHLEQIAASRAPLGLARDLASGKISDESAARVVSAAKDFLSIAAAAGAVRVVAVATSAVREARNGAQVLDLVREKTGIDVGIIDGESEALASFRGAVHGLPCESGVSVDVGGGSVEITTFRDRKALSSWTLPLGALRLSVEYLSEEPPSTKGMARVRDHVVRALRDAGIPLPGDKDELIGTGGTFRKLAKIDIRESNHPIDRVHGYELSKARISYWVHTLADRSFERRSGISGMSAARAESIVAGSVVIDAIMEFLGARRLTVAATGLREGIALAQLGEVPSAPRDVRAASVRAVASRFRSWHEASATQRVAIVDALRHAFLPNLAPSDTETLAHAAFLLDAGLSIDDRDRARHTAEIALASDLLGFTHEMIAWLAMLVRRADDPAAGLKGLRRMLTDEQADVLARASTLLALADAIERRVPPGDATPVSCATKRSEAVVSAPVAAGWWSDQLQERFRVAFGKRLVLEARR